MAATPDPAVDPAVRELVRRDFRSDPVSAMDWAYRIDDPVLRSHVQTSAGRSWYEQDPDGFEEWLPVSGLESEIRALILKSSATTRSIGSNSHPKPNPLQEPDPAAIDVRR